MSSNSAIIASAGSRKTQDIVDLAFASDSSARLLITTYTNLNQEELRKRLAAAFGGSVPPRVSIQGWLPLLLEHGVRPYQRSLIGAGEFLDTFNFTEQRSRYASKSKGHRNYWLDSSGNIFRQSLAEFAYEADIRTGGAVIRRLESAFDTLLLDESQDLVGWDLEFLRLLLRSKIQVVAVGDPRQHTYSTNDSPKNKKYRGTGMFDWFTELGNLCPVTPKNVSYRCNQSICDFGDGLYPSLPTTTSENTEGTGHDGVFYLKREEVREYVERYMPQALRERKTQSALGLPALNFGQVKGQTFDRVLIFPTKPMLQYLRGEDKLAPQARAKLYVAATRARHSVAFVVD